MHRCSYILIESLIFSKSNDCWDFGSWSFNNILKTSPSLPVFLSRSLSPHQFKIPSSETLRLFWELIIEKASELKLATVQTFSDHISLPLPSLSFLSKLGFLRESLSLSLASLILLRTSSSKKLWRNRLIFSPITQVLFWTRTKESWRVKIMDHQIYPYLF